MPLKDSEARKAYKKAYNSDFMEAFDSYLRSYYDTV